MDEQRPPAEIRIDNEFLGSQLVNVSHVYVNVSQAVIITTEDKLRLCLSDHLGQMEKKRSWIAPLGILVAIVLTLVTATFRKVGLSAATWQSIFIIAAVLVFGWLLLSAKKACEAEEIKDVVERIKEDSLSTRKHEDHATD